MQLEQIGRKDIIEQVGKVDGKATTTDAAQSEQKIAKEKLRSISVNNPFYNKNDLKDYGRENGRTVGTGNGCQSFT